MEVLEDDLRAALLAWPGLAALVQRSGVGHVYFDEVPADVQAPFVVCAKTSERVERGLGGEVHLQNARFEVQCVGGTGAAARSVALALREQVVLALEAVGQPPDEFSAGFDDAAALTVEVVTVEWWA